jgi:hypothetical protein
VLRVQDVASLEDELVHDRAQLLLQPRRLRHLIGGGVGFARQENGSLVPSAGGG